MVPLPCDYSNNNGIKIGLWCIVTTLARLHWNKFLLTTRNFSSQFLFHLSNRSIYYSSSLEFLFFFLWRNIFKIYILNFLYWLLWKILLSVQTNQISNDSEFVRSSRILSIIRKSFQINFLNNLGSIQDWIIEHSFLPSRSICLQRLRIYSNPFVSQFSFE